MAPAKKKAPSRAKKKETKPAETAPVVEEAVTVSDGPVKPPPKMMSVEAIVADRGQYGAFKFDLIKGRKYKVTEEIGKWLILTKRAK